MKEVNYALRTRDKINYRPLQQEIKEIIQKIEDHQGLMESRPITHKNLEEEKKPSNQIFKINRKGGRILASDVSKPMVKGM